MLASVLLAPLLLWMGCLSGCGVPDTPPSDEVPSVHPASDGREPASGPKERSYSVAGVAAERLILRWSVERRPELLEEAWTTLLPTYRSRTFDLHLRAWVARLRGDPEGEAQSLATADPLREAIQAYFFQRPEDEILDLLRAHVYTACKEEALGDCGQAPPFPRDFPVFEQVAWMSHNANRLQQWVGPRADPQHPPRMRDLFTILGVRQGLRVADVGAGEGWFTLPLARAVGPTGSVFATEIDSAYLDFITFAADRESLGNVRTVLQPPTGTGLPPASVDLVLLCEVYKAIVTNAQARDPAHVAAKVAPFLANVADALVPGGRFVVIDHDSPDTDDKAISLSVVRTHVEAAGLRFVSRSDAFGPMQAILVFERD